ncbi:hypothetical protein [Gordonia effusa]|nr:hypothetical protein [Gordonia effusa]
MTTRLMSVLRRTAAAFLVAASFTTLGVGAATAAPSGPSLPVEFDLARYQPVNPTKYRSLAYSDNGRSFFTAGQWLCSFGPSYRYVSCKGTPATAPPGTQGAIITGDQQGPWWVTPKGIFGPDTQLTPTSGFRPPTLGVGKRLTVGGTTCTVPRPNVVACTTGARAIIFTRAWHKFFYPSGDTAHNANPAPRYLPPRLRYWNQLPLSFSPPK